MADVRPFRALRYDEEVAGPLQQLVAPPYDVISPEQREELRARSPYNVVHLTLPDDEAEAAETLAAWRRDGVLVEEPPAFWALSQDYVGPDGVSRVRNGLVASLRVEPYETRAVLPHERTHRGPKEGRLRLLRATRTQLEPIFLLHHGPPVELPQRPPDLEIEGARLWTLDEDASAEFADRQLLIADGHHRYETALAFHEEDGSEESAFMPVVLVSTREEGLTIFPTHRVVDGFEREPPLAPADAAAREALDRLPPDRAGFVVARNGDVGVAAGDEGEIDVAFLDRFGPHVVSYTPDADEALAAGQAVLVRPPRVEQVFEVAERGEVMPQKSTYFFPKLVSGLLFHPL
jgi:uncharacterized protein (DUF1015 family)